MLNQLTLRSVKRPCSNFPLTFYYAKPQPTGQSVHMASFKNESQIILAFCDFDLHEKNAAAVCHIF